MENLGKEAKDKITGFKGIIIGKCSYLFGCDQYGIAAQSANTTGKRPDTEWFDKGRVEIIGAGIDPGEVQVEEPGAEYNYDSPKC